MSGRESIKSKTNELSDLLYRTKVSRKSHRAPPKTTSKCSIAEKAEQPSEGNEKAKIVTPRKTNPFLNDSKVSRKILKQISNFETISHDKSISKINSKKRSEETREKALSASENIIIPRNQKTFYVISDDESDESVESDESTADENEQNGKELIKPNKPIPHLNKTTPCDLEQFAKVRQNGNKKRVSLNKTIPCDLEQLVKANQNGNEEDSNNRRESSLQARRMTTRISLPPIRYPGLERASYKDNSICKD